MFSVTDKPEILFPSSSLKNFSIGQTVVFSCTVGGNFPVTYRWFKGGEELTSGNRYAIDDDVGVLTIRQLQSQDAGIYSCIATNDAGTDNIRIELVVTGTESGIRAKNDLLHVFFFRITVCQHNRQRRSYRKNWHCLPHPMPSARNTDADCCLAEGRSSARSQQ